MRFADQDLLIGAAMVCLLPLPYSDCKDDDDQE